MLLTGNYTNAIGGYSNMLDFGDYSDITNVISNALGRGVNNVTGVTQNNEFNALEAQKQRDWEERMSNTQYQRTVSDMKAAGLNPSALMSGAQLTTLGSSSAATSGSGQNVIGGILNAILGVAKASAGRSNVTVNKIYR